MMKRWQILALIGVVIASISILITKSEWEGKTAVTNVTQSISGSAQEQFKTSLAENRPVLVLFHSLTCVPCKLMEERVNEVRPDFEDWVTFVDVNVYAPENQGFVRESHVQAIPITLLVDAQGQEQTIVGAIDVEPLREHLYRLAGGSGSD